MRIEAASSAVRLPSAELMSSNAPLLGAKMVMSGVSLTVSNRLVALMAPRREESPAAESVSAVFSGIANTVSMM